MQTVLLSSERLLSETDYGEAGERRRGLVGGGGGSAKNEVPITRN